MTTLLAQRVNDGHDPLGVAVSAFAARASGLLAPQDKAAEFSLGVVVRRRHAIDECVSEERRLVRHEVSASAAHAAQTKTYPAFEMAEKDRLEAGDEGLKVVARLGSVAHPMPASEMGLREQEERFTELLDFRKRPRNASRSRTGRSGVWSAWHPKTVQLTRPTGVTFSIDTPRAA